MQSQRRLVVCALLLAACGDDGGASVDPSAIVGMWGRVGNEGDPPVVELAFAADGAYSDGSVTGTWSVEDDHLRTQGSFGQTSETFYVSEDELMLEAMLPMGTVSGLVGTWAGDWMYADGKSKQRTFEIRADNTITWTEDATMVFEGTWEQSGSSLIVRSMLGSTPVNLITRAIPDAALGELYEREL